MYIIQMSEKATPGVWWDLEYDLGEPDHDTEEGAYAEMNRVSVEMKPGSIFKVTERIEEEQPAVSEEVASATE